VIAPVSLGVVAGSLIPHKSGVVKRRRRVGAGGAVNGTRAARVGPRCAGGGARSERRIVERQLGLREAVLAVVLEQGELVVRKTSILDPPTTSVRARFEWLLYADHRWLYCGGQ